MEHDYQDISKSPKRSYILEFAIIFLIVAVPTLGKDTGCPIGKILCLDSQCTIGKFCDLNEDCDDSSDEKYCVTIDQGMTGPTVAEGSDVTLTCRFDSSMENRDVSQLHWYNRLQNGTNVKLPEDTYNVIDNKTSEMTIYNITGIGEKRYLCKFEDQFWLSGGYVIIYVGVVPEPPNLNCFSRNPDTFWCKFETSAYTGIRSNFTLEFRRVMGSSGSWHSCEYYNLPKYGVNTCFVGVNENPGYEVTVRVKQSNFLGSEVQQTDFNPTVDVIPYPPSDLHVTAKDRRLLEIEWGIPRDWIAVSNEGVPIAPLDYRIRYTNINNPAESADFILHHVNTRVKDYTLSSLLPYRTYNVQVQCKYMDHRVTEWSDWANLTVRTLPDKPIDTVQDLHINNTQTSTQDVYQRIVTLVWKDVPVEAQNGEILKYEVTYQSDASRDSGVKSTNRKNLILDISKFHEYTVKVTAHTSAGKGPEATFTIQDLTRVPIPPKKGGIKILPRSNSSLIEVVWEESTDPAGYVTAYQLQASRNNNDWRSGIVNVDATQLTYVFSNLAMFTQYFFRLRVKNAKGVSKWTVVGPEKTLGQTPGQPLFHEPEKLSKDQALLEWESPTQSNRQIDYYLLRYRPVVDKGQRAIAWKESQTSELETRLRVNCSLVSGQTEFLFEVMAVNEQGRSEPERKALYMCGDYQVITIVVSVLAVCFCITLLMCCILCVRQSDITKPAPEPYFIDAILKSTDATKFQWKDNRNSPKHEKESFDTLRSADSYTELLSPVIERMSSKDSSTASTDQGIHDMDIDSLDLKISGTNSSNSRRCNRYSSGTGHSCVSEGGHLTVRSNSNLGMEVLSEDYEDSVFEDMPQDIDDGSSPCLSHTYTRSSGNYSPPLSPNGDIGSSSSLLSNTSSGTTSLAPYSQMAHSPHQRLSSSDSDTSGVNYHMMGITGLMPINNNKESTDTGSMAYSKLSQIPTSPANIILDVGNASEEDSLEYNQMGLRNPIAGNHHAGKPTAAQTTKGPTPSESQFNIPSVHIGCFIKPRQEIIVATALMPNEQQQMAQEKDLPSGMDACVEAKPCEQGDTKVLHADHSYSKVGKNSTNQPVKPPALPKSTCPKLNCANSLYIPNGGPNGFAIPNGTQMNCAVPTKPCNQGYVPNNSPPQSVVIPPQSSHAVHFPPKVNLGKIEGYAPATPQAMAAIVGGNH